MNACKTLSFAAFLLAVTTIASAQKIATDFNHDYNLAALKTFAFLPLAANDALRSRPEVAARIQADLKTQLEKGGFREDDANPDFLVFYSANKATYTSTYSSGAAAPTAGSQVWSEPYQVGMLVTDLLDPKTREPFWRGTATETVYATGSMQKYAAKGVQKLVEAFQKDIDSQRGKGK